MASVAALVVASVVGLAAQYPGWLIPLGGKDEKSPISPAAVADAVKRGKAIYVANCVQCHGADGKGTGQDANYATDLTDDLRTQLNTEGYFFTRYGTATPSSSARRSWTCRPSRANSRKMRSGRWSNT